MTSNCVSWCHVIRYDGQSNFFQDFLGFTDFSKFLPKPESLNKNKLQPISYDTLLLSELPFFLSKTLCLKKKLLRLKLFRAISIKWLILKKKNKFITIFLNINGIFNKCYETDEILKKVSPDALSLSLSLSLSLIYLSSKN